MIFTPSLKLTCSLSTIDFWYPHRSGFTLNVAPNGFVFIFLFSQHFSRSYRTQYDRLFSWFCRLSVFLSICNAVHCGTQGCCRGWKLYDYVPKRTLPIHFFRHFYCMMYRLATKQWMWPLDEKAVRKQRSDSMLIGVKADVNLKL